MSALAKTRRISPEEYLAGERGSQVKHGYVAGEIYAMSGASKRHNEIASNIHAFLRARLKDAPCKSFMEGVNVRVQHPGETAFYYPDVFVTCDPRDTDEYFPDYPSVIFEVLSPDTARQDGREKRWA